MKTYTGGCHCGAVRYSAQMNEITECLECNCSHCEKAGLLLSFIPASQFTLEKGEAAQTEYRFNKNVIEHLFCKTCGIQSFARGKDKEGNDTVTINIRTIDGIDLTKIKRNHFNGRDW